MLLISNIIKLYQILHQPDEIFKILFESILWKILPQSFLLIHLLKKGSLDPLHALKVVACKM